MKARISLVLLMILCGCFAKDPVRTGHEGNTLPAFSMLLSDSISHLNTNNIPASSSVVFFYFGPYCPYSRAQMDEIVNNIDKLKDIHFYLLTYTPYAQMKDFYNHYNLNRYSNITVGIDDTKFFQHYFSLEGVPFLAVYGKDKKLRKAFMGEVKAKQINQSAVE